MENIWYGYQKNVEEYGCDKESSLKDVVKKALDVLPLKAPTLYRCPFCGSEHFARHQFIHADVYVDGDGEFDGSLSGRLEESLYGVCDLYGSFTCVKSSQELDELPDNEQVKLSKGTFPVVYGKWFKNLKRPDTDTPMKIPKRHACLKGSTRKEICRTMTKPLVRMASLSA